MSEPNYWQNARVRLRAIEPGDAETLYQWNQDSERNRLLDFVWPPISLALVRRQAEEMSQRRMDDDSFQWMIETPEGAPVGTIATHHCSPHNGTFSLAVDIAAGFRGQGYAGQAVWLVLHYYFEELRYQKANVEIHADNPASLRLFEKLGFRREGLLRRMVYTGGQYLDLALYGLTGEEFHSLPEPL